MNYISVVVVVEHPEEAAEELSLYWASLEEEPEEVEVVH